MREESVDGTLSPVSMKGGIELLDNDTGTARRKVTGFYIQIFPSWCCNPAFETCQCVFKLANSSLLFTCLVWGRIAYVKFQNSSACSEHKPAT
jgi:hypothetical protein